MVSILTIFVVVKEMSYKIILGEPWAVRAQLIMERTATGQVSCIIRSEDGLWETRFLAVHSDPDCIKKDEAIGQRDCRMTRSTIKQQAQQQTQQQTQQPAPPQEKNIRPGDYIQIRSRPADKTAKARKKNGLSDPWRRSWRQTLDQSSSKVGEGMQVTAA